MESLPNHLRLCLVAVKRFSENTYFSKMLISGKRKCFHVFGCISKNFLENIFWCLEKKKENTNQKTQSHNPGKKIINDHNTRSRSRRDRDRRCAIAMAPDRDRRRAIALTERSRFEIAMAPDRDRQRAIAIAITERSRWRQIAIDGVIAISPSIAPSDWSWSSRSRTGSSPLARARSLYLSLSLFFRK